MATAGAKAHRKSKLHEEHEEHVNHERWLITYADMITLLMVLFIVLYSISQVDLAKFRRLKQGIAGGFGGPTALAAVQGGAGPLQGRGAVFDAQVAGSGTPPPWASSPTGSPSRATPTTSRSRGGTRRTGSCRPPGPRRCCGS